MKKNKQNLKDLKDVVTPLSRQHTPNWSPTSLMGSYRERKREERIFEEIMSDNFQTLINEST